MKLKKISLAQEKNIVTSNLGGFMLKPNYAIDHGVIHDARTSKMEEVLLSSSPEIKSFKNSSLPALTNEEEFVAIKYDVNKNFIAKDKHNVDFGKIYSFITDNKVLLNQYFKLRNQIFQKERGWTKKTWFESEHDRNGKIVVSLNDLGEVIGGARLMVSNHNNLLSGEIGGTNYTYKNLFETLGLDSSYNYSEIDGLIVDKDHRDRRVTEDILKKCIEYSLFSGCAYIVGIAYLPYCRIYRSAYRAIGYENVSIAKDFMWSKLEEYNNSEDFPIVNVIRPEVLVGRNF